MEIKSTLTNHAGEILDVVYRDVRGEDEFSDKIVRGVHAYAFYGDKLVVVYAANKGYWTPPGGGVEVGESARDAVRREVKEETNMRVLKQRFIGYQDVSESGGTVTQTRSVCLVEPDGPFVEDPDGDITEIKLIDPKEYKNYFDWGVIGDHIMERALEIKAQMEAEINYTI
jgi:ADP-ribose pyrophosphatase YjhB (NUDIX family)